MINFRAVSAFLVGGVCPRKTRVGYSVDKIATLVIIAIFNRSVADDIVRSSVVIDVDALSMNFRSAVCDINLHVFVE